MRKIIAVLISLIFLTVLAPTSLSDTEDINVTLTPSGNISINVDQPTWGPSVGIGGSLATDTDWANLDNDGNVQVDVTVEATNTTAWTLETAPAHNKFQMQWGTGTVGTDTGYIYVGGELTVLSRYYASNMTWKDDGITDGFTYALAEDDDYIYAGSGTTGVHQYWKTNMTEKTNAGAYVATAIAVDDTYVYVGAGSNKNVYQYWKSNMTEKTNVVYGAYTYALIADDNYIYVGGTEFDEFEGTWAVYQYYKSNMTKKSEFPNYGDIILALAEDDTYLYAGGSGGAVKQYLKSDASYVAGADNDTGIRALADDDTYIYAGGALGKVHQYWKSNMTKTPTDADYGSQIRAIVDDDTYIYVGGVGAEEDGVDATVQQYWKSNMTKTSLETVPYGRTIMSLVYSTSEGGGGGESWTNILTSPASFVSNLAWDQSQDFGLQVFMPTSTSSSANQTSTITFTATAD